MTLIVAGYTGNTVFNHKSYNQIFFVGDTLLSGYNSETRQRDRLIEVYKKIRLLPVKVWVPKIDAEGYFRHYLPSFNGSCVIAFAGSALTFGHMLNGIQEHLAQLRYTHAEKTYKIVKHCSKEAMQTNYAQIWAEDLSFHYDNLPKLTADFQMEVISHVIKRALRDISGHRLLDQRSFDSIRCELAISLFCWEKCVPELFHVEVILTEEIPRTASFTYRKLGNEETVVLGKPIQKQVEEALHLVRNSIKSRETRMERGEGLGGDEMNAIKSLIREHIQEDIKSEANYIGGHVDCWKFQHGEAENWYETATPQNDAITTQEYGT
ncbi:hypothetical protein ACMZ49_10240 [Alcaligenes phenolicus]